MKTELLPSNRTKRYPAYEDFAKCDSKANKRLGKRPHHPGLRHSAAVIYSNRTVHALRSRRSRAVEDSANVSSHDARGRRKAARPTADLATSASFCTRPKRKMNASKTAAQLRCSPNKFHPASLRPHCGI